VAVAVGAAAFALAADTGGSARIPAALCGLVGFRPTTGRWPDEGLIKVSPTRDTIGAIVRHVDDLRLLDTVLTGDVTTYPIPPVHALRLALPADPYLSDLDPEVAAIVDRFLDRLLHAGAVLVRRDGRALHEREAACGFLIALHEARIEMTTLAGSVGLDLKAFAARIASPDVRDIVSSLVLPGDESEYERALGTARFALQGAYAALFSDGLDALLMPTTALAAARIGEDDVVMLNGRSEPTFSTYARQTSPSSVAGLPSVSIPIGCTDGGLPVGMLVEGPAGTDRRLLATAIALSNFTEAVPQPVLTRTAARRGP
jgi:mandelamide amidase